MSAPVIDIVSAMTDEALFEPWFRGPTWAGWRSILKAAYALPMTDVEIEFFRSVADRDPPKKRVREFWIIAGRRAGKDSVASMIAAHSAALFGQSDRLRPGERAVVACIAYDKDQARIVHDYTKSYFDQVELLKGLVQKGDRAADFELANLVDVKVLTNNFRAVRGRPILCAIFDEIAFWRDEKSATPDQETYKAIKPGLVSLMPSSMIVAISSPYRKAGLLYTKFKKHFGRNDDDVLVIKAPTRALNPTIPQEVVDEAMAEDPSAARSEWLAEFRDDLEDFVSQEVVDACVVQGRHELPPMHSVSYSGFCDPSGGSSDSMTLAIAHREGERAVLDAIREVRPPFSPEAVVAEFAALLKTYRIKTVVGDRYAGLWPTERFDAHGIRYDQSAKPKSDLYRDLLPILNGRRAELLDHTKLAAQLCSLERRTARGGRDSIDHPPNAHDDVANAVAGALTGLILQDWSGGRAIFEVMRQQVEAEKAALAKVGGHPPGEPQPVTREWAVGSVEWHAQQRGDGPPPPQTSIPAHHIARHNPASAWQSEMDEGLRRLGMIT